MPRALKVCSCIGCPAHGGSCPELVETGRCPPCSAAADKRRGSRQQRGYDRQHERERERWQPAVELGQVDCAAPTCVMPIRRILLGQAWDLGHTEDRTTWRGPEHMQCNRGWRRERNSR